METVGMHEGCVQEGSRKINEKWGWLLSRVFSNMGQIFEFLEEAPGWSQESPGWSQGTSRVTLQWKLRQKYDYFCSTSPPSGNQVDGSPLVVHLVSLFWREETSALRGTSSALDWYHSSSGKKILLYELLKQYYYSSSQTDKICLSLLYDA